MKMDPTLTVIIPTLGRVELLTQCLRSIGSNDTFPSEVLISDQSGGQSVHRLCEEFPELNIRVIACPGRGVAKNRNFALKQCKTELALITDDDCIVSEDWVHEGAKALRDIPNGMVTGKVLPGGDDPDAVPSTMTRDHPVDFTGKIEHGALYPNNMGIYCNAALESGGFDERKGLLFSEDLDFSYRWLKAGRPLRYVPEMAVIHADWRSPKELVKLYKRYARYAGRFYGKHVGKGDFSILRFAKWDMRLGYMAWKKRIRFGTKRHHDERLELPLLIPIGLIEGVLEQWYLRITGKENNLLKKHLLDE